MALHVIKGIIPPASPPTELGEHYVDTVALKHYLAVGTSSVSNWVLVGDGAATESFLSLTDTPSSYTGKAAQYPRVNGSANGLVFDKTYFIDAGDTPTTYTGQTGRVPTVNALENGLVFLPVSASSLPPGGTTNQSLTKLSNTSGDAGWVNTVHTLLENNIVYVDGVNGSDILTFSSGNLDQPFQTIGAAVTYVTAQVPDLANGWSIRIQNGIYNEDPLILPAFCGLFAIDPLSVIVQPKVDNTPLLTLVDGNIISGLAFNGVIVVLQKNINSSAIYAETLHRSTISQCVINNFAIGIRIKSGASPNYVDCVISDCYVGNNGPVPIACDFGEVDWLGVIVTGLTAVGDGTPGSIAIRDMSGQLTLNSSSISGYETGFFLDGAYSLIANTRFESVMKGLVLGGGTETNLNGCYFHARSNVVTSVAIHMFNNAFAEINGCDFNNYYYSIHATEFSYSYIATSNFYGIPLDGTCGIRILDGAVCKLNACSLTGTSEVLSYGIYADGGVDGYCFIDCFTTKFQDFKNLIYLVDTVQCQTYSCGFEGFVETPGIVGCHALGISALYAYDTYFLCETGLIVDDDAALILTTVELSYAKVQFWQRGNGFISLNVCNFNEDDIIVENWSLVTGNYNSTKEEDQGLVILSKFKVGVPELGEISSQGQGNSFSRGMLVYEYDSITDTYTDVTEIAKQPEGDFGIPNGEPDSAVYWGCTLKDPDGNPLKFYGLYLTQTVTAELGLGSLIAEYWDGSGWSRMSIMMTLGVSPFYITQINLVPPDTKTNARFSSELNAVWETSDPILPLVGEDLYWMRIRVESNWADSNWAYRIKITIPATVINGTVTNFQTYMNLVNLTLPSFWTNVKADGGDIRMTTSDGVTQVPLELVTFNAVAKTGSLYYTAPSLTNAASDTFFIYYGNPAATFPDPISLYGSTRVWKDYDAVFHMGGSGQTYHDSTINGFNGSGVRTTRTTTGKFQDQAAGDNTNGTGIFLPVNNTLDEPGRLLTYDAWFRCAATLGIVNTVAALPNTNTTKGNFFGISIDTAGILQYELNTTATSSTVNVVSATVYSLATISLNTATATTGNYRGYLNGIQRVNANQTVAITNSTLPVAIGNRGTAASFYLNGLVDEVRIARAFRQLNWHVTLYNNMNTNNTWQTFGAQEQQADAPGSSPIDVPPRWSQSKLWPSSAILNPDGYPEYFGNARQVRRAFPSIVDFNSGTGTDYAAVGGQVWLSQEFGVLARYTFTAAGTKRITAMYRFGNDGDLSCPIRIRLKFLPKTANNGDVLLKVIMAVGNNETQYYTTSAASPVGAEVFTEQLGILTITTDQLNKEVQINFLLPFPAKARLLSSAEQTETLWISIIRYGDSVLDTYTGAIDLVTMDTFVTAWRDGAHNEF